ncbi:hypothetical protein [Phenylobacterium sp.]|uniref:hypothetical protein n=1 Tax=Phenylobacterium sp. TaxID=1871053 RepID=UPI002899813B|nr:hypothetical protein [Phenylobacterium sp.]
MKRRLRILVTAAAIGASASLAGAAAAEPWSVSISPYVWAASLDGKATLAGFRTHVDVPFSDVFEHLDLAALGEVEVRKGRWGLYLDGQYVKTSQDEELMAQELGLGIVKAGATGGVFYRIYDSPQGGDTVAGEPRRFVVEPMIGMRWTKLKADVEVLGFRTSKKADWTEPFVGVRSSLDLTDRWNLSGEADVGGFDIDNKRSANAQAFVGYRTRLLSRPAMLRAGYRVLHQSYETGDFTGQSFRWDVTQQGPVIGLTMGF